MLTKAEKEIISNFVDEQFAILGLDILIFDECRFITEQPDSKIVVVVKQYFIDKSRQYETFLRNPIENDYFIPKELDFYVIQFDLGFDRKNGFQITNLYDVGVVESEAVKINDAKITDDCLRNLVSWMCFDVNYQSQNPEVKTAINNIFLISGCPATESLKRRIGPFIGILEI
jgi:hypothetical protein